MHEVVSWLLAGDPAIRWQVVRDLLDASPSEVAGERAVVSRVGWAARLLDLQGADGAWDQGTFVPASFDAAAWQQEGQPWTTTFPTLVQLLDLGVDPADDRVADAVKRVAASARWDQGGQRFFDGEVEPCINGRVVRLGAAFGHDVSSVVERLLHERLPDGGWNCEAPSHSHVSSFHTTINVLEGLHAHALAVGGDPRVDEALREAEEYLLVRGLFRRRSTGEVIDPGFLTFSYPTQWRYDVLRGLDYFRSRRPRPDARMTEAIALVEQKRGADGRWLLEDTPRGRVHFSMEADGQPSRWNTLRALRVLRWAGRVAPVELTPAAVLPRGRV